MEKAMLTVLAQRGRSLSRKQILIFTGYRNSGSTITAFSTLIKNGWVGSEADGCLFLTEVGARALGTYDKLPAGAALRDYVWRHLPKMEAGIFAEVTKAYPGDIARETVLEKLGYRRSGSTISAFSQLIAMDYISVSQRGRLRAAEEFFA